MNIIFVCTGNTCRSPMAEGYLAAKKIPWITVISRGIAADGSEVSRNAAEVMKESGIDISGHISSNISEEDIENANRIICLSGSHRDYLECLGVKGKRLSVLGDGISDPCGGNIEVYRKCRDEIFGAVDKLFENGFFSEFVIVPIEQRHISAIAKLEATCFSEPWSANAVLESHRSGTAFFIAENSEHVMGYIGIKAVLDEGYITNVAVFSKYRRTGVGTALINKVISFAREKKLAFVSLEVRKSNAAAISLYEKNGFKVVGERRDFYRSPVENALIMTRRFECKDEDIKH